MSQTAWNILGILTILAGILLFLTERERFVTVPPDQYFQFFAIGFLIFGFLGIIASTCFFPKVRPFTLRVLGTYGIFCCVFNLITGFKKGDFSQFPMTICFWLPGSVYLVVKGKMD